MADENLSGEIESPKKGENELLINMMEFPIPVPHAKEWISQRQKNIRPWLEFFQTSNLRFPTSLPRLIRRFMRNIDYFQSNYIYVALGLTAYCLITSPLLLFVMAGALYGGYKLSKKQMVSGAVIKVCGRELTSAQQYGILFAFCSPLFYLAGAGTALAWTLGASCIVISLHAIFYNIDSLISEPEDAFNLTQEV